MCKLTQIIVNTNDIHSMDIILVESQTQLFAFIQKGCTILSYNVLELDSIIDSDNLVLSFMHCVYRYTETECVDDAKRKLIQWVRKCNNCLHNEKRYNKHRDRIHIYDFLSTGVVKEIVTSVNALKNEFKTKHAITRHL